MTTKEVMLEDIRDIFRIEKNYELKQWEFEPQIDGFTSYTVSYKEADDMTEACIAVWKSIRAEYERKNQHNRNMVTTQEYLIGLCDYLDMNIDSDPSVKQRGSYERDLGCVKETLNIIVRYKLKK